MIAGVIFLLGFSRKIAFVVGGDDSESPMRKLARIARALASFEVLADVVLLRRLRDQPARRLAHACVLLCFLCLFFIGSLGDRVFATLGVADYHDIPWFALVNEVAGLVLVLALGAALVRGLSAPRTGSNQRRQWAGFIALLLAVSVSGYVVEALRLATEPPAAGAERYSFVAALLAGWLKSVATVGLRERAWWGHAVLSLGFIAYLPFSRGVHIFLAPMMLAVGRAARPASLTTPAAGLPSVADRLALEACVSCGECMVHCEVIRADHPGADEAQPERFAPIGKIERCKDLLQKQHDDAEQLARYSEGVFDCTLCGRCTAVCPIGIDTRSLMIRMREDLVAREAYPESLDLASAAVENEHNVLDFPNEDRTLWMDLLDDYPDDVDTRDKADTLYYVGCMSSFSPAVQEIPQALLGVLQRAGEDVAVLGQDEWCCGFPLIVAGRKREAVALMEHNLEQARRLEVKRVVFNCPSCYHTWKHYYRPQGIELVHETEYIAGLLRDGRLSLDAPDTRITYHDPCDLGRGCGVYDAPREVMSQWQDFVELSDNRELGMCCGGGGDLEMYNADLAGKVNASLAGEIRRTEASTVATACPQCKRMLLRELPDSGDLKVRDIAELVMQHGHFEGEEQDG